jgi:hypothetical protein
VQDNDVSIYLHGDHLYMEIISFYWKIGGTNFYYKNNWMWVLNNVNCYGRPTKDAYDKQTLACFLALNQSRDRYLIASTISLIPTFFPSKINEFVAFHKLHVTVCQINIKPFIFCCPKKKLYRLNCTLWRCY